MLNFLKKIQIWARIPPKKKSFLGWSPPFWFLKNFKLCWVVQNIRTCCKQKCYFLNHLRRNNITKRLNTCILGSSLIKSCAKFIGYFFSKEFKKKNQNLSRNSQTTFLGHYLKKTMRILKTWKSCWVVLDEHSNYFLIKFLVNISLISLSYLYLSYMYLRIANLITYSNE